MPDVFALAPNAGAAAMQEGCTLLKPSVGLNRTRLSPSMSIKGSRRPLKERQQLMEKKRRTVVGCLHTSA